MRISIDPTTYFLPQSFIPMANRQKWVLAIILLVGLYLVYLVSIFSYRYKREYETYTCELSSDSLVVVEEWQNIGIRVVGESEHCFFPDNISSSRILEFCGALITNSKEMPYKAIVKKEANSNKIQFIVGTDTLNVRMKKFRENWQ